MPTRKTSIHKPSFSDNRKKTHRKSKFGCRQCREKKVKCDERLPCCTRCSSKSFRCSYLDLSQSEIDLIKIAHWEKEGSDPSRNPIPTQMYHPDLNHIVVDSGINSQSVTPPVNHNESLTNYRHNNGSSSIDYSRSSSVHSVYSSPLADQGTNQFQISQPNYRYDNLPTNNNYINTANHNYTNHIDLREQHLYPNSNNNNLNSTQLDPNTYSQSINSNIQFIPQTMPHMAQQDIIISASAVTESTNSNIYTDNSIQTIQTETIIPIDNNDIFKKEQFKSEYGFVNPVQFFVNTNNLCNVPYEEDVVDYYA